MKHATNLQQIYINLAELVLLERNLQLYKVDNPKLFRIMLYKRHDELTPRQCGFICAMIANKPYGTNNELHWQFNLKMSTSMYASHATYHKVRKELLALNVIAKVGNRNRFYLNPEFHPALPRTYLEQVEQHLNNGILRLYQQQFGSD